MVLEYIYIYTVLVSSFTYNKYYIYVIIYCGLLFYYIKNIGTYKCIYIYIYILYVTILYACIMCVCTYTHMFEFWEVYNVHIPYNL